MALIMWVFFSDMAMVLLQIKRHIQLALHPYSVAVGDFNNDTILDIIVANYGTNNLGVLLGYGNGTFANMVLYSVGVWISSILRCCW